MRAYRFLMASVWTTVSLSLATAAGAAPSETACAKAILSEVAKLQSAAAKALASCDDAYRKDIAKGDTSLAKAAPACENQVVR
jgi:hypothetical protein